MLSAGASKKHQLWRVACFLRWRSSLHVNGNDIGSLGRHSQCLALVGFVQHVGYAGLLRLLDATAFKSLHANTAGGAPLWTVKDLSLPGFNGYIT